MPITFICYASITYNTLITTIGCRCILKSLKDNFYKACGKYTADNPGRVVTTDVIASLLGEAWPQSVTPVNIMSGFRKCGKNPLNPGQITDCQTAPSLTFHTNEQSPRSEGNGSSASVTTHASNAQELLFQKQYEEGFDLYDVEYVAWLQ